MQGTLTNETRCLRCETITARDETFLDLSLDIEQNSSITSCLRNFSSTETLNAEDKFFCDKCCRWVCYRPSHIEVLAMMISRSNALVFLDHPTRVRVDGFLFSSESTNNRIEYYEAEFHFRTRNSSLLASYYIFDM